MSVPVVALVFSVVFSLPPLREDTKGESTRGFHGPGAHATDFSNSMMGLWLRSTQSEAVLDAPLTHVQVAAMEFQRSTVALAEHRMDRDFSSTVVAR